MLNFAPGRCIFCLAGKKYKIAGRHNQMKNVEKKHFFKGIHLFLAVTMLFQSLPVYAATPTELLGGGESSQLEMTPPEGGKSTTSPSATEPPAGEPEQSTNPVESVLFPAEEIENTEPEELLRKGGFLSERAETYWQVEEKAIDDEAPDNMVRGIKISGRQTKYTLITAIKFTKEGAVIDRWFDATGMDLSLREKIEKETGAKAVTDYESDSNTDPFSSNLIIKSVGFTEIASGIKYFADTEESVRLVRASGFPTVEHLVARAESHLFDIYRRHLFVENTEVILKLKDFRLAAQVEEINFNKNEVKITRRLSNFVNVEFELDWALYKDLAANTFLRKAYHHLTVKIFGGQYIGYNGNWVDAPEPIVLENATVVMDTTNANNCTGMESVSPPCGGVGSDEGRLFSYVAGEEKFTLADGRVDWVSRNFSVSDQNSVDQRPVGTAGYLTEGKEFPAVTIARFESRGKDGQPIFVDYNQEQLIVVRKDPDSVDIFVARVINIRDARGKLLRRFVDISDLTTRQVDLLRTEVLFDRNVPPEEQERIELVKVYSYFSDTIQGEREIGAGGFTFGHRDGNHIFFREVTFEAVKGQYLPVNDSPSAAVWQMTGDKGDVQGSILRYVPELPGIFNAITTARVETYGVNDNGFFGSYRTSIHPKPIDVTIRGFSLKPPFAEYIGFQSDPVIKAVNYASNGMFEFDLSQQQFSEVIANTISDLIAVGPVTVTEYLPGGRTRRIVIDSSTISFDGRLLTSLKGNVLGPPSYSVNVTIDKKRKLKIKRV